MIRVKAPLWIGALVAGATAVGVQAKDASFRGGTSFSYRRAAEELRLDLAAAYAYAAPALGSFRISKSFSKNGWSELTSSANESILSGERVDQAPSGWRGSRPRVSGRPGRDRP